MLDRRVIEFLVRVPGDLKVGRGWTKLLLRVAMQDLIPDELRLNPKKPNFGDVMNHGIRKEGRRMQSLLEDGYLTRMGWVQANEASTLPGRFLSKEPGLYNYLVGLVTLMEWLEYYIGSNGGDLMGTRYHVQQSGLERR
jgi:hypothetical protein